MDSRAHLLSINFLCIFHHNLHKQKSDSVAILFLLLLSNSELTVMQ